MLDQDAENARIEGLSTLLVPGVGPHEIVWRLGNPILEVRVEWNGRTNGLEPIEDAKSYRGRPVKVGQCPEREILMKDDRLLNP